MSDDFYDNEKMLMAGSIGRDLYWHAIAYCNRNLTDGLVSRGKALSLVDFTQAAWLTGNMSGVDGAECAPYAVAALLDARLWHENGHDCPDCVQPGARHYVVHDYLKYQLSRDEIESRSEQAKERQRRYREARDAQRNASPDALVTRDVTRDKRKKPRVINGLPQPQPQPQEKTLVETQVCVVTKADAQASDGTPGCSLHPNGTDTPCGACCRKRQRAESERAKIEQDDVAAKRNSKARRESCIRCGGTNTYEDENGNVRKCASHILPGEALR